MWFTKYQIFVPLTKLEYNWKINNFSNNITGNNND